MAWLVKVLQVQRVVPDLVAGLRTHAALAYFELDHDDDRRKEQHGIDSTAHARDGVLEDDVAGLIQ
jgi:hypothetical protein